MDRPGPAVRVVGRYALYDEIASGGMATVRFGRFVGAEGFSRTVAVKCLHPHFAADPEFLAMFRDEARLAARIASPHVVPTIDVLGADGDLFIVMEFVHGESLARLLRATEPHIRVPVPIAVSILSGVLEGLHAAHEARSEDGLPLGIVHRDVSPQNILVGRDGIARVIDFGVAKAAGRLQTTRNGELKGKLGYMAPEQLRREQVTRAADIYAASVVLWETLVGERLFGAKDEGAVITRVLTEAVVPPSRAAAKRGESDARELEVLDPLILRGLDRNPARRFQTARELATAIQTHVAPASAAAVSEWVERIAGSGLTERAARIVEIESGVPGTRKKRHDGGIGNPRSPPALEGTATELNPSEPTTQVSSISVSSNVGGASPPRRLRFRRVSTVLTGTAIVLGAYLLGRSGAHQSQSTSPAEPLRAAPVVGASPPASTPIADAAVSREPAQPPATVSAATPRGTPPARAHRPLSNAYCNPPYTWDQDHKKIYKPSCL
jgi:serine/threonine-protein kinase